MMYYIHKYYILLLYSGSAALSCNLTYAVFLAVWKENNYKYSIFLV